MHEIVAIDRNIRRMISRGAETEEIEAYAREQQGMRSLKEKGLELVKQAEEALLWQRKVHKGASSLFLVIKTPFVFWEK